MALNFHRVHRVSRITHFLLGSSIKVSFDAFPRTTQRQRKEEGKLFSADFLWVGLSETDAGLLCVCLNPGPSLMCYS